jgi:hypothetical protein
LEIAMSKPTALAAVAVLVALGMFASREARTPAQDVPSAALLEEEALIALPRSDRAQLAVQKWEYKTIRHDLTTETRGDDAQSKLNALGEDGWELCATVRTDGLPFLLLKRPAKQR